MMGNFLIRSCTGQMAIADESNEGDRGIIYDVWDTISTQKFAINLQKYLRKRGYNTSITDSLNKELQEEKNCPIIALCLLHSRPEADINYTLTDLNWERSKGIIIVLLHFRSKDTTIRVKEDHYKKDYPQISVHNCFLQQEFENINNINKDILRDLERREIEEIRKNAKSRQDVAKR